MVGWKITFLSGWLIFRGELLNFQGVPAPSINSTILGADVDPLRLWCCHCWTPRRPFWNRGCLGASLRITGPNEPNGYWTWWALVKRTVSFLQCQQIWAISSFNFRGCFVFLLSGTVANRKLQVSHEKKPWLFRVYIGDYTTVMYGLTMIYGSLLKQPVFHGSSLWPSCLRRRKSWSLERKRSLVAWELKIQIGRENSLMARYCWWFRSPKANHLGWC